MIIGYNFLSDEDSITPTYLDVGNIKKIKLTNALFNELSLFTNLQEISSTKSDWSAYNLLLAKFQGNLNAGNVDFTNFTVATLKIKRRKSEELNNWYTLKQFNYVSNQSNEFFDNLNVYGQEYDYAIVPTTSSNIEGEYITNTIFSEFNSAYVCEKDVNYKLLYDMNYDDTTRISPVAVFQPIGSKYPLTVRNGLINYEQGGLKALVLSQETESLYNGINRVKEISHRKTLLDFFTNGNTKILKDFNRNVWMIQISDNPQVSYTNELSQALANISIKWVEIGSIDSKSDLYYNNLIERLD